MYSKQFARDFQILLEFVDDLCMELYNNHDIQYLDRKLDNSEGEYGAYIWNKNKSLGLFIGFWMNHWVDTGNPLIVSLEIDYRKGYKDVDKSKFSKYVNSLPKYFSAPKTFDKCLLAEIKAEYIPIVESEIEIAKIIKDLYIAMDLHQQNSI